jgi:lipopolysaccharide export LptBFGC system permease protein LptF
MQKKPTDPKPVRSNSDYRKGLVSGVISGLVWGGIVSAIFYLNIELNRTSLIQQIIQEQMPYTTTQTLDTTNSSTTIANSVTTYITSINFTGGQTPSQYISSQLLYAIGTYLIIGLIFGALIGAIFAATYKRFLKNMSLPIRGVALGFIFWVLYFLAMVASGTGDLFDILTSLVTSLVAGFVLGYFFQRLGRPPPSGTELAAGDMSGTQPVA